MSAFTPIQGHPDPDQQHDVKKARSEVAMPETSQCPTCGREIDIKTTTAGQELLRDFQLMKEQVRVSDEAFNFHLKRANELMEMNNDLLEKLERYEKALRFYSDETRWIKSEAVNDACEEIQQGDPMMVFIDGEDQPWSVAHEALKGPK